MQKVIAVSVENSGQEGYTFHDIKEVNDILSEGYKVVSATPAVPAKGYGVTYMLVLEKKTIPKDRTFSHA